MKKRLLILCAVGVLAFNMPVYADTQTQDDTTTVTDSAAVPDVADDTATSVAPADGSDAPIDTSTTASDDGSDDSFADSESADGSAATDTADATNTEADTDDNSDTIVVQEADDPVTHVTSMIRAIPAYDNLTLNDEQVVDEIQTAYDDLSDVQKELVLNRETLNRAQQKLQDIRDQLLYTYSFTLTDKYPVARMNLNYAPPSDDSLDTRVMLGSKTDEAAFEIITPDKESFILTPDTKTYDTKNVHFTVVWSNRSVSIKAENCELGTWFMKSSYPVSFAVQKYESVDEMNGEDTADAVSDNAVSNSSVVSSSEIKSVTSSETRKQASNPFIGVIGMLAAVAGIGVGAIFLVKFLSKKKFAPQENDESAANSSQHMNSSAEQIQNAESMDDLDAIMNSKWQKDMDSVPNTPETKQNFADNRSSDDTWADNRSQQTVQIQATPRPMKQTQQSADSDYGFSDTDYSDNNSNDGSVTDSMHDSDFMDDDDSDTSRDTTYLSYEEDINEQTGILNNDKDVGKVVHKQPFYPKNSYDPENVQKG